MEQLEQWLLQMPDAVLVAATCSVEGGLAVDPPKAADNIFEFALCFDRDVTMEELTEVTQTFVRRAVKCGGGLGSVLAMSRQLVHAGGRHLDHIRTQIATARDRQDRELHHHVLLYIMDLYEASRRTEPLDESGHGAMGKRTPRNVSAFTSGWWHNPPPPPHRADIDVKCYGFIGLNAIVSCDVVDVNNATNSFRLDAMGLSYLVEGEWMGFVEELTLNLDTTRRVLYIYTEGRENQYIVKKKAAGWRDCSRLLRQLVTVASCSGVDLHVDECEHGPVLQWILGSTEKSEVGNAVSVWYSAADAADEGWYPGTVEQFSATTGKYTVYFETGERAEHVHPASMTCLARVPLIGHFWSAASPLWKEPKQVLLQGLARWMARTLHRQWIDDGYTAARFAAPFFPAFLETLAGNEKADYVKLCLGFFGGDERAFWEELLAVSMKVGLVCITCNMLFRGLADYVEFSTHVAILAKTDPNELAEEPIREVNKVLSFIAAAAPQSIALPAQVPSIDTDGTVKPDEVAAFAAALG
eukprot:TRINITY_DN5823_c0_g1_i1.p1 TRINITY_DN5823_c0_g1~~TRINITY_DN5823_c0_g1_i1.p1  ORF type:complete len:527 (+),score=171.54 TRINITY_DN5823_c0_g1_i1:277-1857(+)